MPWFGLHGKYRTPFTVPLFFPPAESSWMPIQSDFLSKCTEPAGALAIPNMPLLNQLLASPFPVSFSSQLFEFAFSSQLSSLILF
jgi:hypothetical protein